EFFGRTPNVVVDDDDVELLRGRHLDLCGLQSATAFLTVLGAASDEPTDQLLPARGGKEDEERLRHRGPQLTCPLQVDLEQWHPAVGDRLLDGVSRSAVAVATVHEGPLEHVAPGD